MSTQERTDQAWLDVSLDEIVRNARTIHQQNPSGRLLPMVKANAYGLGSIPVSRALEVLSPWGFGVATVEEGAELRRARIERPIVAFTTALEDNLQAYRHHNIRPVLDDPRIMRSWGRPFHLEVDTGMCRGGVSWDSHEALEAAFACGPEGVFTHLHSADTSPTSVQQQLQRFSAVTQSANFPGNTLVHVANGAGAFHDGTQVDLTRPGVFLYGGRVGADQPSPRPVAALKSRVVSVRTVRRGDTVSYGADWTADRDTVVATLGAGYADGVRRSIQGRGMVILSGRRVPVVGRVTMDMTMVALPHGDDVAPGDVVTFFGPCDGPAIELDEFAGWANTVSYEILTGLGNRLPRVYI